MSTELHFGDAVLRLALAFVGGALIGAERETTRRPAGLRTTLLVTLAACFSMLQANALMGSRGKSPDSFVVLDLMRFPLGILSGMGFIGAGAILRKDNLVLGVTTAATLWFATVMGLCFGGGQLKLGLAAAIAGLLILRGLKWVEAFWQHEERGMLRLVLSPEGMTETQLTQLLKEKGYQASNWSMDLSKERGTRELHCEVHWRGAAEEQALPAVLAELAGYPQVLGLAWERAATSQ